MNNDLADSWMSMKLFPPERFETMEVRLSDDSVVKAIWTGAKWWSNGKTIEPCAWRLLTGASRELVL